MSITIPFSTTYNAAEQDQTSPGWVTCDGISALGSWNLNPYYEQITTAANYALGGGARGQRHWMQTGKNINTGSVSYGFSAEPELYIRWYTRWQSGLQIINNGQKLLYFFNGWAIELAGHDFRISNGNNFTSPYGWNTLFPSGFSDESWHWFELHVKNNGATNGIGQIWVDGVLVFDRADIPYNADFAGFRFPENAECDTTACVGNAGNGFQDCDDVAIQRTGPIGPVVPATLPVVPGAFGFGMNTRAAYGLAPSSQPTVQRVTNLNDSGAGSLRAALLTTGPRVVIFEISGTIDLQSDIIVTEPYLTVAGQTAPSPGITIRGGSGASQSAGGISLYGAHDVLIQHLRCRPGDGPPVLPETAAHDGYLVYVGSAASYNVVFDHVSVSWTGDKLMNLVPGPPANITVWRSIMSEALYYAANVTVTPGNPSSLAMLIGGTAGGGYVSVFQSLFAHNSDRNPELHDGSNVHFINNVVYDWGKDTTNYQWAALFYAPGPGGPWFANFIGNQYVAGTPPIPFTPLIGIGTYSGDPGSQVYLSDNAFDQTLQPITPYVNYMGFDPRVGSPALPISGFTIYPSSGIQAFVLINAGARPLDRDAVDTRIVSDVQTYTGTVISSQNQVGGWPTLAVNVRPLTLPANPNNVTASGYTNLELWLQQYAAAVEPPGPTPPSGGAGMFLMFPQGLG